jgi:ABC-2 type transport system ATP-binding protein
MPKTEPLLRMTELKKHYRVTKRKKGFWGYVSAMVAREYQYVYALDGINLTVEKGEAIGFIGPNGAGKSTTIKLLTGILTPTSGEIFVDGIAPYSNREQNAWNIGVVFGQRTQLWWDVPASDSFVLLKHIYNIEDSAFKAKMGQFDELLELRKFLNIPVRQLSLGQRVRVDIAAALLHDPKIIYLDEPTIGLDIMAKAKIREFVKYVNKEKGTTVIFTTHDMQDIEKTCERIVIVDRGKIMFDGTISDIRDKFGEDRILVVDFKQYYEKIEISETTVIKEEHLRKWLKFRKNKTSASDLLARLAEKYEIVDIFVQEPDIEGIIRNIYLDGATYGGPTAITTKAAQK